MLNDDDDDDDDDDNNNNNISHQFLLACSAVGWQHCCSESPFHSSKSRV